MADSPGQFCVLQISASSAGPSHSFPPCSAGSNVRLCDWVPPPQDNEQSVQLDHALHLQSTGQGSRSGHACVSVGSPVQLSPP